MSEALEKTRDALYRAVADYIEARNGKAVVVGGVEVQQFPQDNKLNYRLAVKFTGRRPEKDADE